MTSIFSISSFVRLSARAIMQSAKTVIPFWCVRF